MEKENFDTPEWRKYFEDKSSEEIEKIKKTFGEKIGKKENTQKANRKELKQGILTFLAILTATLILLIPGIEGEKKKEVKRRNEWNKITYEKIAQKEADEKQILKQERERKIPLLESGLTEAMKADTKHISDAKVKVSVSKEGKYLVICSLYFKPDISKDVITFYCKSVCEKSFTGYPDIDYNRTIIRGYKNGDLIEEYSPLTEKSEKVNDEARWREWKKEKYGEMGASSVSDYEAQKQWHRDYRAGKSVPLPSPERRKEIDKMIEDIFR